MLRFGALTLAAGLCLTAPAHADDVLHPGAVNVDRPRMERRALAALARHAARDIGRTEGDWRNGSWRDFDPRSPLRPA